MSNADLLELGQTLDVFAVDTQHTATVADLLVAEIAVVLINGGDRHKLIFIVDSRLKDYFRISIDRTPSMSDVWMPREKERKREKEREREREREDENNETKKGGKEGDTHYCLDW